LKEESYGFIFGIVAFTAVILETIITIIIVSEIGFGLPPRGQVHFIKMFIFNRLIYFNNNLCLFSFHAQVSLPWMLFGIHWNCFSCYDSLPKREGDSLKLIKTITLIILIGD